jgi:hypothetical protein
MIVRFCILFFILLTYTSHTTNGSDSDHSCAGAGSGVGIDHHQELIDYLRSYTEESDKCYFKAQLCHKLNIALPTYDFETTKDVKRFEEILATFIEMN